MGGKDVLEGKFVKLTGTLPMAVPPPLNGQLVRGQKICF